jgi:hypothetical protein
VRLAPHWRKAPLTLLRHRPVLAAVAFGAFLVAFSSASSPFFTTATGSAALRNKLREMGPYAAGLDLQRSYVGSFRQFAAPPGLRTPAFERQARALVRGIPFSGEPVLTTIVGAVQLSRAGNEATSDSVRLTARTGFLDKVIRLQGDPHAPGVWLADTTAETLHVRPGDRVEFPLADPRGTLHRTVLPVAGIYEALWKKPYRPEWVNFTHYIYPENNRVNLDPVLPPVFAFMPQDELDRVMKKADVGGTDQFFELPFTARSPLLSEAKGVRDRFATVHRALTPTFTHRPTAAERASRLYFGAVIGAKDTTSLPQAIAIAEKTIAGVAAPTQLLAEAGALIALVVVGASGAFLVARRRAEARTLFARGEAVPSFAGRTVVEAVLPSIGGGALGVAAALALIRTVEPNGRIDVSTLRAGALAATLGVAAGLLLVGASAGVAYARLYEVGARTHPLLRRTPWELVALAAGIVLLVRLRHGGGLSHDKATGIAHPSLVSFLVPVLLVGGVAAFLARIGGKPLRLAADRAWAAPLPVLLALRRLAAGRGVLSLLVVTSAIALGVLLYAQTLVSSLEDSVRQKAYIAAGSDAQGIVDATQPAPRHFPFPVTRAEIVYGGGRLGNADGDAVDVMGIDPKTLPAAVHWVSSWGPPPSQLVAHLDDPGRRLHVLATGPPTTLRAVNLAGTQIPVDVTWVHAFPGMSGQARLVVFSQRRLDQAVGGFDPLDPPWAYLWAKGPTKPVVAALLARPASAFFTTTAAGFRTDPNVALALRTFAFMRALGIAAGTLALFCLVLYLLARQRAQAIATAFERRMGLRRWTAAAALVLELGLILAVALVAALAGALVASASVVPHSDPLPQLAPAPVFAGPWLGLALILATLSVLTVLAGLVASRAPRDEALVEAIRLE